MIETGNPLLRLDKIIESGKFGLDPNIEWMIQDPKFNVEEELWRMYEGENRYPTFGIYRPLKDRTIYTVLRVTCGVIAIMEEMRISENGMEDYKSTLNKAKLLMGIATDGCIEDIFVPGFSIKADELSEAEARNFRAGAWDVIRDIEMRLLSSYSHPGDPSIFFTPQDFDPNFKVLA